MDLWGPRSLAVRHNGLVAPKPITLPPQAGSDNHATRYDTTVAACAGCCNTTESPWAARGGGCKAPGAAVFRTHVILSRPTRAAAVLPYCCMHVQACLESCDAACDLHTPNVRCVSHVFPPPLLAAPQLK